MTGDLPMPSLPESVQNEILKLSAEGFNISEIARKLGRSRDSVRAKLHKQSSNLQGLPEPRLPEPTVEAGGPSLPEPWDMPIRHLQVDNVGHWLVLGDIHLPMHDKFTIESAVKEAKETNCVGVLLNGDVMDMFNISPFRRIPTKERFIDEIEMVKQFTLWVRSKFPKARIIWREGNHELRYQNYIIDRAQALFELKCCQLDEVLELNNLGIEWIAGKGKVNLGKLTTLHGHELIKGEGVNPAILAFLRTTGNVLVGHWHRISEHHQRGIDDKDFCCWSHGCACYLRPNYSPYNQWGHGFAFVEIFSDGKYTVQNRNVLDNKTV
jgi:predicted phosphodiesterase